MNIVRWIGGIVVGHLTRTLFVWGTGWLAFGALGVDAAFRPHAWVPSARWLAISAALGFTGAILGGVVASAVGRDRRVPQALAALLFGFGLLTAATVVLDRAPAEPRPPGDLSVFDALRKAEPPVWVALLNSFIDAGGVLLGARLHGRRRE